MPLLSYTRSCRTIGVIAGIGVSIAGLLTFGNRLSNTAYNVADRGKKGYIMTHATMGEESRGLPQVNLMKSNYPGAMIQEEGLLKEASTVDPAREFPRTIAVWRGYGANIQALQAQDKLLKTVLDIMA